MGNLNFKNDFYWDRTHERIFFEEKEENGGFKGDLLVRDFLPWPLGRVEDVLQVMVMFDQLSEIEMEHAVQTFIGMGELELGKREQNGFDTFINLAHEIKDGPVVRLYGDWAFIGGLLDITCDGEEGTLVPNCFHRPVARRMAKKIFLQLVGDEARELKSWEDIEAA